MTPNIHVAILCKCETSTRVLTFGITPLHLSAIGRVTTTLPYSQATSDSSRQLQATQASHPSPHHHNPNTTKTLHASPPPNTDVYHHLPSPPRPRLHLLQRLLFHPRPHRLRSTHHHPLLLHPIPRRLNPAQPARSPLVSAVPEHRRSELRFVPAAKSCSVCSC